MRNRRRKAQIIQIHKVAIELEDLGKRVKDLSISLYSVAVALKELEEELSVNEIREEPPVFKELNMKEMLRRERLMMREMDDDG